MSGPRWVVRFTLPSGERWNWPLEGEDARDAFCEILDRANIPWVSEAVPDGLAEPTPGMSPSLRDFAAALDAFTTAWWSQVEYVPAEYVPAAEGADPRLPFLDRRSWRDKHLASVFRKLRHASEDLADAIGSEEAESSG